SQPTRILPMIEAIRPTEGLSGADKSAIIHINLKGSKKRKRPGNGSRVGAGEELGGVGALVAARGWGTLSGGLRCPGQARGYGGRPQGPTHPHPSLPRPYAKPQPFL